MRFFTKEWYNDTLIADMCFQLRKNESASVFSERFFERLYAVEERAYIKYYKRNAKATRTNFSKDDAAREFASNYKENLEFVKANLPEDILADVKDIRVLALGTATHDIAMRITRFCGKKNRLCENAERNYNNASEEADERVGGAVVRRLLSLIGAQIISLDAADDGDVSLTFASVETGKSEKLILKDAVLTESDGDVSGSVIVKYELLTTEDEGFEFSLLLLSDSSSLLTVTYKAASIETE